MSLVEKNLVTRVLKENNGTELTFGTELTLSNNSKE